MPRKQKSDWDRKVEAAVVHAIAEHQQAMFRDPNRPDLRPPNLRALFQRAGEMHGVAAEEIAVSSPGSLARFLGFLADLLLLSFFTLYRFDLIFRLFGF